MKRLAAVALLAAALTACGGGDEPTAYTSADGSFSVLFPGEPDRTEQTAPVGEFELDLELYVYEDSDNAFLVNQYDYAVFAEQAGMSNDDLLEIVDLDGAVDGAIAGMGGAATSVESGTVEGREARFIEFTGSADGEDFEGVATVVLDGLQLYQVLALGTGDTDEFEKFVDSFDFLAEASG